MKYDSTDATSDPASRSRRDALTACHTLPEFGVAEKERHQSKSQSQDDEGAKMPVTWTGMRCLWLDADRAVTLSTRASCRLYYNASNHFSLAVFAASR